MKQNDIKISQPLRRRMHPDYGFVIPLRILQPKTKDNPTNHVLVEGKLVVKVNDYVGMVAMFRLCDLIKCS